MNNFCKLSTVLLIGASLNLVGCGATKKVTGVFKKDPKIDYKTSRKGRSLEVPPDLNSPDRNNSMSVPNSSGTATYSGYQGKRSRGVVSGSGVLPSQEKIKFVRKGDKFWLIIQGSPQAVWTAVREYWLQNGFILAIDNPTIGIMETDWAENRANIKKGRIRKIIGKVFSGAYSSGTRDRFRVRLERGAEAGTTELYLTHKGMVEVLRGGSGSFDATGTAWKHAKRNTELEVEMLKRIMVHVGVGKRRVNTLAKNASASKASSVSTRMGTDDQGTFVDVNAKFSRAWRVIGLALDRTGFNVVDRNRSAGIYYVQYNDPDKSRKKRKGIFKMFGRKKKKKSNTVYQIKAVSSGETTRVRVFTKAGAPEKSSTGKRIMTLLKENLK